LNELLFIKNIERIKKSFHTLKKSNDFYRDFLDECNDIDNYNKFSEIPILTKENFRNNYSLFYESVKDKKLEYYSTSGTNGKPLKVFRTIVDDVLQNAILNTYRMKRCPQIVKKKGVHFLFLYNEDLSNNFYEIGKYNNIFERFHYFTINNFVINEALIYINKSKPLWIVGSVSFILKLAEYEIEHRIIKHKLDYIECNSEYMHKHAVDTIREAFGVEPTSIYGSNEHGIIAYQCKNGNMHVVEENVFVEIIENNVIITSLANRETGLIRYAQGDLAEWSTETCLCELNGPIIELTGFRKNDFIICDDISIDMWFFHGFVKKMQKIFNIEIEQYKVVQDNKNINILLKVRDIEKFIGKKELQSLIKREFDMISNNNFEINVDFVKRIDEDNKTGKFKYFERIL